MKEQKRPESAASAAVSEPEIAASEGEFGSSHAQTAEEPVSKAAEGSAPQSGEGANGESVVQQAEGAAQPVLQERAAEVISAGTSAEKEALVLADPAQKPAGAQEGAPQYTEEELKKRKRNNTISFLISLIIIGGVVYALFQLSHSLQEGDFATFQELLANTNWWYMLIAVALFLAMFLIETLKYTMLTRTFGYKLGFKNDVKIALTGKYYESITPFSSGGQPMQIYYMYKLGVPGTKSTSITIVKYGVQMLAFTVVAGLIMGLLAGELGSVEDEVIRTTIFVCGWVGFGVNAFIPVTVVFVVFCPRAVTWVLNLFVKLLYKIKIIKNAEKIEAKVRKWMDDFAIFSQMIFKKPLVFVALFVLCLGEPIIELIIPYYVLIAMCGQYVEAGGALFLTVISLAMYATYAAVFIPTPGNSGAVESVFMLAFAALTDNVLFWFVLVWRFILYYTYIIAGVGMNVTDMVGRIRKNRRERLSRRQ